MATSAGALSTITGLAHAANAVLAIGVAIFVPTFWAARLDARVCTLAKDTAEINRQLAAVDKKLDTKFAALDKKLDKLVSVLVSIGLGALGLRLGLF